MHHDLHPGLPDGSADETMPVDRTVLSALSTLDPDDPSFVVELVEMFLEGSRACVEKLAAALASGDLGALEREAHTLKSSSASLGALPLSEVCASLEGMARSQASPREMSAAVERIREQHARSERFLEAFVSEPR